MLRKGSAKGSTSGVAIRRGWNPQTELDSGLKAATKASTTRGRNTKLDVVAQFAVQVGTCSDLGDQAQCTRAVYTLTP